MTNLQSLLDHTASCFSPPVIYTLSSKRYQYWRLNTAERGVPHIGPRVMLFNSTARHVSIIYSPPRSLLVHFACPNLPPHLWPSPLVDIALWPTASQREARLADDVVAFRERMSAVATKTSSARRAFGGGRSRTEYEDCAGERAGLKVGHPRRPTVSNHALYAKPCAVRPKTTDGISSGTRVSGECPHILRRTR